MGGWRISIDLEDGLRCGVSSFVHLVHCWENARTCHAFLVEQHTSFARIILACSDGLFFTVRVYDRYHTAFEFHRSIFSVIPHRQSRANKGSNVVCRHIVVSVIVLGGYINARTPIIKTLELSIPKNGHAIKSLNIAVASDIHLGTIVCKSKLERIVEHINSLNPDLVLLPGDVVDEDIGPVIRNNLGETLRKIQSKYGVFAITGNHEYIGGVEPACQYLAEHGITMLRDAWVKIGDSLYVVGREDISIRGFTGKTRKPLPELMAEVDKSYPVILMDHQPFRLEEAEINGVDLQLSGHTHHGQLWPFNFITKKVYELSWGYKKKEVLTITFHAGLERGDRPSGQETGRRL